MAPQRIAKQTTLKLSKELLDAAEKLPMSRSALIVRSISNAGTRPDVVHLALRRRMTEPRTENNVRVSYTRDPRVEPIIERLVEMTDLSAEQVIRLCMSAYIHQL